MKLFRKSLLTASVFALLFALNACGDIFGFGENFLKAEFDGVEKEWNGAMVSALEVDTFNGVIIQGIKTTNLSDIEQISIALAGFDGEGTYTNGSMESSQLVSYTVASTDTTFRSLSINGEVSVTSYQNSVIEGTFEFTLRNMVSKEETEVKNGSFKAKLIE
ncbi:MAG: hypothetical protein JXQ87_17690 [Bacteroidia bacterium]